MVGSLERVLGFMSDESFRFDFVAADNAAAPTQYFDFPGNDDPDQQADEVVLFSGGLDSLTGAVDRLSHGAARLILVSHQSSTKIADRQRHLAGALATRFPGRVLHVPVRVSKHGVNAIERTQRTRSFLFGAIGTVVARIAGAKRLSLFENGIVSFNLPIAAQVVGAVATRTTHPRVVRDTQYFLSTLLQSDVAIENPFLWKTKAEVAGLLQQKGQADLARHTVSCSSVHGMTRLHTHCGRCSQCLDRRFGTLAAGLGDNDPAEMYETDLLTGARERNEDRTMAESFVRHALELEEMGERGLMTRFGGEVSRALSCVPGFGQADVAKAILELHRRHAAGVRGVLEDGYRHNAAALAAQTLPSTCVLRLVAGTDGVVRPPAISTTEAEPLPRTDPAKGSRIRLALDSSKRRLLIDGLPPIEGHTRFELVRLLVATFKEDRDALRAPENHTYSKARALCDRLRMTDVSLRRCVYNLRQRLARDFETELGRTLSGSALIESSQWKGYRLNPDVLVVAAEEVGSGAIGHGSPAHRHASAS